jgi:hypothetical protein
VLARRRRGDPENFGAHELAEVPHCFTGDAVDVADADTVDDFWTHLFGQGLHEACKAREEILPAPVSRRFDGGKVGCQGNPPALLDVAEAPDDLGR